MTRFTRPTVCIVDAGIRAAALEPGRLLGCVNLSGQGAAQDVSDAHNGHGSAVAATVLAHAPSARLVVVKLLDDHAMLDDPGRVETAFEWINARCEALGIGVVCAPLADGSHQRSDAAYRDSRLCRLIAALRARGVASVMPAGNGYLDFCDTRPQGMAWPGILREVVSVGALSTRASTPALHPCSQRLHAGADTACRTTVFARPGAPGGTSGATARVAGHLAALQAAQPGLGVDDLVNHLLAQSRPFGDASGAAWPAWIPS